MFDATVKVNPSLFKKLDPKLAIKVEVKTTNTIAKEARKVGVNEIFKEFNIKKRRLTAGMPSVTKGNRATTRRRQAKIRGEGTGNWPGLQHYGAKPTKKGVTYKVIRKGGRKKLKGSFAAKMPNGGEGIFKRRGTPVIMTKGRYKGERRQPIVRKTGPSIPYMFRRVAMKSMKSYVKLNYKRQFKANFRAEQQKVTKR